MDLSDNFSGNLEVTGNWYKSLPGPLRNKMLNHLIDISDPSELFVLSAKLHKLLKRDFISQLPPELSTKILQYLSHTDLEICSLVSVSWHHIIATSTSLWKGMCVAEGIIILEENQYKDAEFYKTLLLHCKRRLEHLDEEMDHLTLTGHNDRVMAVAYHGGKIATGSDDHTVRIWDGRTGACLKILRTHTVATLKFDNDQLITGSYDSTAALWDLKKGGTRKTEFIGHVSAVFSVDYDVDYNILVTGSADNSVKVWLLSEGTLLRTLNHPDLDNHWVLEVSLCFENQSVLDFDGDPPVNSDVYFVVSRNNDYIVLHKLEHVKHTVLGSDTMFAPGFGTSSVMKSGMYQRENYLCCIGVGEVNIVGAERPLNFVRLDKKYTSTCLWNVATTINYNSVENKRSTYVSGGGGSFTALLHNEIYADCCLDVYSMTKSRRPAFVKRLELPTDCRLTASCLGDKSWLNGLDGINDSGVFCVVALKDHNGLSYAASDRHLQCLNHWTAPPLPAPPFVLVLSRQPLEHGKLYFTGREQLQELPARR